MTEAAVLSHSHSPSHTHAFDSSLVLSPSNSMSDDTHNQSGTPPTSAPAVSGESALDRRLASMRGVLDSRLDTGSWNTPDSQPMPATTVAALSANGASHSQPSSQSSSTLTSPVLAPPRPYSPAAGPLASKPLPALSSLASSGRGSRPTIIGQSSTTQSSDARRRMKAAEQAEREAEIDREEAAEREREREEEKKRQQRAAERQKEKTAASNGALQRKSAGSAAASKGNKLTKLRQKASKTAKLRVMGSSSRARERDAGDDDDDSAPVSILVSPSSASMTAEKVAAGDSVKESIARVPSPSISLSPRKPAAKRNSTVSLMGVASPVRSATPDPSTQAKRAKHSMRLSPQPDTNPLSPPTQPMLCARLSPFQFGKAHTPADPFARDRWGGSRGTVTAADEESSSEESDSSDDEDERSKPTALPNPPAISRQLEQADDTIVRRPMAQKMPRRASYTITATKLSDIESALADMSDDDVEADAQNTEADQEAPMPDTDTDHNPPLPLSMPKHVPTHFSMPSPLVTRTTSDTTAASDSSSPSSVVGPSTKRQKLSGEPLRSTNTSPVQPIKHLSSEDEEAETTSVRPVTVVPTNVATESRVKAEPVAMEIELVPAQTSDIKPTQSIDERTVKSEPDASIAAPDRAESTSMDATPIDREIKHEQPIGADAPTLTAKDEGPKAVTATVKAEKPEVHAIKAEPTQPASPTSRTTIAESAPPSPAPTASRSPAVKSEAEPTTASRFSLTDGRPPLPTASPRGKEGEKRPRAAFPVPAQLLSSVSSSTSSQTQAQSNQPKPPTVETRSPRRDRTSSFDETREALRSRKISDVGLSPVPVSPSYQSPVSSTASAASEDFGSLAAKLKRRADEIGRELSVKPANDKAAKQPVNLKQWRKEKMNEKYFLYTAAGLLFFASSCKKVQASVLSPSSSQLQSSNFKTIIDYLVSINSSIVGQSALLAQIITRVKCAAMYQQSLIAAESSRKLSIALKKPMQEFKDSIKRAEKGKDKDRQSDRDRDRDRDGDRRKSSSSNESSSESSSEPSHELTISRELANHFIACTEAAEYFGQARYEWRAAFALWNAAQSDSKAMPVSESFMRGLDLEQCEMNTPSAIISWAKRALAEAASATRVAMSITAPVLWENVTIDARQ